MTRAVLLMLLIAGLASCAWALERFPPPEFTETNYRIPPTQTPPADSAWWNIVDTLLLIAALGLATWLALKRRSRRGLLLLTLGALAYFGFVRQGCVCPVGAVQNCAQGLFDSGVVVPWVVVAFFVLPLIFALFVGRVFCAGICPLGAIQDVVVLKPLRVPPWLEHVLGLGAWVVLAVVVGLAVAGGPFLVCVFDPFVAFFRFGGPGIMLLVGALVLGVGLFLARPYCRYLCPLGALLRPASMVSAKHVTITPDECVQCRLCEDACPFGAILPPTEPADERSEGRGRLALILLAGVVILPAGLAGGVLLFGGHVGPIHWPKNLASLHPDIRLQQRLEAWQQAGPQHRIKLDADTREAVDAFFGAKASDRLRNLIKDYTEHDQWAGNDADRPLVDAYLAEDEASFRDLQLALLNRRVEQARSRMNLGGLLAGGILALAIWCKLISLAIRRAREDYTPNKATCLSCGRCFRSCPVEQKRLAEH